MINDRTKEYYDLKKRNDVRNAKRCPFISATIFLES